MPRCRRRLRLRDATLQRSRIAAPNNMAVDLWKRGTYVMSRLKTKAERLQARTHLEAALTLQPDSSQALSAWPPPNAGRNV
jgi:hypothetical protein